MTNAELLAAIKANLAKYAGTHSATVEELRTLLKLVVPRLTNYVDGLAFDSTPLPSDHSSAEDHRQLPMLVGAFIMNEAAYVAYGKPVAHGTEMSTEHTGAAYVKCANYIRNLAESHTKRSQGYTHVDVYSPPAFGENLLFRVKL